MINAIKEIFLEKHTSRDLIVFALYLGFVLWIILEGVRDKSDVENKSIAKRSFKQILRHWSCDIGVILLLTIVVFGFSLSIVDGESMLPNFQHRELTINNQLKKDLQRLDVITFKEKTFDKFLIKRIYGLENDKVEIIKGKVYVNDELIDDSSIELKNTEDSFGPYYVPKDCYFALGDNRPISFDSRYPEVGFIHKNTIRGKVIKTGIIIPNWNLR